MSEKHLQAANYLLASDGIVEIVVDPRVAPCVVPAHLEHAPFMLEISPHFPVPIRDLRLDVEGVSGLFTFGGAPFDCLIPWAAVAVIRNTKHDRGIAFFQPLPVEPPKAAPAVSSRPRRALPEGWRVIEGGGAAGPHRPEPGAA